MNLQEVVSNNEAKDYLCISYMRRIYFEMVVISLEAICDKHSDQTGSWLFFWAYFSILLLVNGNCCK